MEQNKNLKDKAQNEALLGKGGNILGLTERQEKIASLASRMRL